MAKLLSTKLSTQVLHFQPGRSPQTFDVTVNNHSSEFATFQLELLASGVDAGSSVSWYRQAPDLSAKIPAGDRTQFSVTILEVPPVPGGFVGTMTLTVRVFSVELRQEDRQVVSLVIKGSGIVPPRIELLSPELTTTPQQSLEIPVRLTNPNRSLLTLGLSLRGLPLEWLPDGNERRLEVSPMGEALAVFLCRIPAPIEAPSQTYLFELEAQATSLVSSRTQGRLKVLPAGQIAFEVVTPVVTYPVRVSATEAAREAPRPGRADQVKVLDQAKVVLQFANQSNLPQEITPVLELQRRFRPNAVPVSGQPLSLPVGAIASTEIPVAIQRPWVGWVRSYPFHIKVLRPDEQIALQPESQTVRVRVLPRVRVWQQLGILGLLAGALLLSWLWRTGHHGGVSTVQFDGRATEVLSASKDQTVRRWAIAGRGLQFLNQAVRADKAVRVARYRPVGNDAIAIGYENGRSEIRSLRVDQPPIQLQHQPDDRIFDLRFTRDANTLFTGYGSGDVARWDLAGTPRSELQPAQLHSVGFAVQSLAVVDGETPQLAIAGRFNQLKLWNWKRNTLTTLPYPQGSDLDYITSLAVADQIPTMLAVADNQGRIGVWNLRPCLTGQVCRPIDDWEDGHQGQAVEAVALSEDGCYLASGGADGQTMLWSLDADGRMLEGKVLGRGSRQPINTVDITRRGDRILVVSGSEDHRVRFYDVADTDSCRR